MERGANVELVTLWFRQRGMVGECQDEVGVEGGKGAREE